MSTHRLLMFLAAFCLLIGPVLPPVSVANPDTLPQEFSIAITGAQEDNPPTEIIGVLLLLIAITIKGSSGKRYSVLGAVLSVLAALLVVHKSISIASSIYEQPKELMLELGFGTYIVLLGSVCGIFAGWTKLSEDVALGP